MKVVGPKTNLANLCGRTRPEVNRYFADLENFGPISADVGRIRPQCQHIVSPSLIQIRPRTIEVVLQISGKLGAETATSSDLARRNAHDKTPCSYPPPAHATPRQLLSSSSMFDPCLLKLPTVSGLPASSGPVSSERLRQPRSSSPAGCCVGRPSGGGSAFSAAISNRNRPTCAPGVSEELRARCARAL